MTEKVKNELDWTAFCYVAGELDREECAAFEELLGEDQAAREAVARAVATGQVTALVWEHPVQVASVRSASRAWSRRLAWVGCGVAAGIVMALFSPYMMPPEGRPQQAHQESPADAPRTSAGSTDLALAWALARADFADLEVEAGEAVMNFEVPLTEVAAGALMFDGGSEVDLETPSWMFTAVAGQDVSGTGLENE